MSTKPFLHNSSSNKFVETPQCYLVHVGFYEPKNPRLFISKILQNLVQIIIETNLHMERFGELENYAKIDKAIINILSPLSNPSMHAIVSCNMGLANHPKKNCIMHTSLTIYPLSFQISFEN
jgi:hypothetical protein